MGLPNVGKSTLFNTLTKMGIPAENFPFCTIEPNNVCSLLSFYGKNQALVAQASVCCYCVSWNLLIYAGSCKCAGRPLQMALQHLQAKE